VGAKAKKIEMSSFVYDYFILIFFALSSLVISVLLFSVTFWLSRRYRINSKAVAYECGFQAFSSARLAFDVHFFVVALLFLVFYIDLLFLYPWATCIFELSTTGFVGVYFFLLIIIVGYCYEWRRGSMNWVFKS